MTRGVLERMHERGSGASGVRLGGIHAVVEVHAHELHRGAVVPGGLDLRHRCVERYEDRRVAPGLTSGPRDRLAVVARARGDDARLPASSLRVAIRLYAPRTLNEPVR